MLPKVSEFSQFNRVFWPFIFVGVLLGIGLSWSVLGGDAQGRVNILYLLLVYLLIPILSLALSLSSLLFSKGVNLASLLSQMPFWSAETKQFFRKNSQLGVDKHWLLWQSQLAAIAFSIISLLVFFLLLLATDINFVWRSTILSAQDLLHLLELVASPWQFWPEAQPSLELLQSTQDSRLISQSTQSGVYANWWQFILAVQIFYSFIPRVLLLALIGLIGRRKLQDDVEYKLQQTGYANKSSTSDDYQLAELIDNLPRGLTVTNWADIDLSLVEDLPFVDCSKDNLLKAGPSANDAEQSIAERWRGPQLVIVKSWEPPLGELEDYLENSEGVVFPIDWKNGEMVIPKKQHLLEWRRFIFPLKQWKVFSVKGQSNR
ncbi:MAG: DUF2868 domain-containing protein [Kangiellaceae bacterium]|nr:DUF2868 domain-containing protein [Kangiellaceae bacterium]MCW9018035.1 DUF2868 domain-containing protein [Kangiellaceae bacterium]